MTATINQLRHVPLALVAVHEVAADWSLPSTFRLANHSGLVYCQTLTNAAGSSDRLLSVWRSERAFASGQKPFVKAANADKFVEQWNVRAQKLPDLSWRQRWGGWAYASLATLVAVLGYFGSLPEHYQSLASGARLELRAAPHHCVLGNAGSVTLSVRNVQWRVPTFVHLEAPVCSDNDTLDVEPMSTSTIPELGSGRTEEVRFGVRAKRPGNCTINITCHGKAGFFRERQTFTTTIPVTVWRHLDTKLVPAESAGEALLRFVIFAGEAQPNGLGCDLAIIGGGMKVAQVSGRDIRDWSAEPIRGNGVEITQWTVPPLAATSTYTGVVRMQSTDSFPLTVAKLEACIASGQLELRAARRP